MGGPFGPDDPAEPDVVHGLRWPAGFSPECSDVWARSELAISAPPAVVFSCLVSREYVAGSGFAGMGAVA